MSNPMREQRSSADQEHNLDVIERRNLKRLVQYVPDDFSLEETAGSISSGTRRREKFDRRAKSLLYKAIVQSYLIMLAAEKMAEVKTSILASCDDQSIVFRHSTPLAHRVVRLHMTDDSTRVSEYAKAMRGAVIEGFSPTVLEKRLLSGDETIESLGSRLNQKMPSTKKVKLVFSASAERRYKGLTRRQRMLAIVSADPRNSSFQVRLLTVQTQRAFKAFKKKSSK